MSIAALPTNRDINATLLMAPAVHPSGPSGAYSIAGALSFRVVVHGERRDGQRERSRPGPPFNLYIEDAIQDTVVATDGVSAEYGRFSGGHCEHRHEVGERTCSPARSATRSTTTIGGRKW